MVENIKYIPGILATFAILIGLILAGCSAGGTGTTTQGTPSQTTTVPAQTVTTPAQSDTVPASTTTGSTTSGSTTSPNQGNASAGGPRGGAEMSKMYARAADILGITEDQLTSAFQEAQKSVFGEAPTGMPPSGSSGQPPAAPSGTSGQQPPSQGQGPGQEMMQKVYSKMAEILNISADKISSAMDQARQELQTETSQ